MDWSVNEKWPRKNRRNRGCLPGLHSHFMTEWKPECLKVSGPSAPDQKRASRRESGANGYLIDSQASPAVLLCSAARYCPFRGKILRDIFTCLGLVCPDNREGGEKSALLRGQSLGRMRSRRGNSLPPDTGNGSDAFKLQGLVPCIFFVQSSA